MANSFAVFGFFSVRGFVTGSTSTSLWTVYDKGVRNYCGNDLAEGNAGYVIGLKLPAISRF